MLPERRLSVAGGRHEVGQARELVLLDRRPGGRIWSWPKVGRTVSTAARDVRVEVRDEAASAASARSPFCARAQSPRQTRHRARLSRQLVQVDPRQMSRPRDPTYRASTAMFHMISRVTPALNWWTWGCLMSDSLSESEMSS
jgi:hypothetical protein